MRNVEESRNRAEMIGPVSGWWVTKGTMITLQSEPDPDADENAPRYSFMTLLNWLNANHVLTTGRKTSDGWIVTIKKTGKNFWASSKTDAIGKAVSYILSDAAHLFESRAA